jgi:hypothetical protein
MCDGQVEARTDAHTAGVLDWTGVRTQRVSLAFSRWGVEANNGRIYARLLPRVSVPARVRFVRKPWTRHRGRISSEN